MRRIEEYLVPGLIVCRSSAVDRSALIAELARLIEVATGVPASVVAEAVRERERYGTTAVGNGVAIPHCRLKGIKEITLAVATVECPVEYDAPDGAGVGLVFLIAVPEGNNLAYLKLLSRISVLANDRTMRQRLMAAVDAADIMHIVKEAP